MPGDFQISRSRAEKPPMIALSVPKWALHAIPPNTWIHKPNDVVLLGDACHPMLPYRAQDTAMAIEYDYVLGNLFLRVSSTE
ncbi:hypothetical protein FRC12_023872 [Ceratobasidium sp. 428]|nr:hypothetical protein FRC12_023872 [Ceratobasidium sp. 428]